MEAYICLIKAAVRGEKLFLDAVYKFSLFLTYFISPSFTAAGCIEPVAVQRARSHSMKLVLERGYRTINSVGPTVVRQTLCNAMCRNVTVAVLEDD